MSGRDRVEASRLFQVEVANVAWELGREHPMFDRLMSAITRHNSAVNRSTGRTFNVVEAAEGRNPWGPKPDLADQMAVSEPSEATDD